MLFEILKFFHRRTKPVERRLLSPKERAEWEQSQRERVELERRLSYLETQAEVYARKEL